MKKGAVFSLVLLNLTLSIATLSLTAFGQGRDSVDIPQSKQSIRAQIDRNVCQGSLSPPYGTPILASSLVQSLQGEASNRIDVAMFYSPKSAAKVGGLAGMVVESALMIRQANDIFERSEIDAELSLVHLAQSLNQESSDISGDLVRVQNGSDGFFDEFITTRDAIGADLIIFVQEHYSDTACGIAYQYSDPDFIYPDFAVAVVARFCIADFVLAHGIGHILGANHDSDDISTSGAFDFSRGLRFTSSLGSSARTVMAYTPGTHIGYFSNPNVTFEGSATGTSSADNASAIGMLAPLVANYRTLAIPTPTPYVPTGSNPAFAKVNSAQFVSKSKCRIKATFFDQNVVGLSGVAASVNTVAVGDAISPIRFSNSAGKVSFTVKLSGKKKKQKHFVSIVDFDARTKSFKCKPET